jgi:ribosomal protein S12 methylthiotransferase
MTFFIESLGCAKNQVDSEYLIANLEARGLNWVENPEAAQIIIVNTCGFINSAKDQSIQTSLALKHSYPRKKVIMLGCLVQRYGAELEREMGEIDGFVPLNDLQALLRLVCSAGKDRTVSIQPAGPHNPLRSRFLSFPGSAYVKIAEGCSNHCSYCAIPLMRGELASRPAGEILEETEELIRGGVVEVVLIAQDLASYGKDRGGGELARLVKSILRLKGQFWLRLLYLHPDHFPVELLDVVADDSRVLPYFDIPFQHASSAVLARMGRSGSADSYAELVQEIRTRIPEAVIRSTFLVGFPGERDEDFETLLAFQRDCPLDWVGVFTYSREEGTPAYRMKGGVKKSVAEMRRRRLEQAQIGISERLLDRQIGKTLDVLVEERIEGEKLYLGRAYLQAPEVDGLVVIKADSLQAGRIYPARIEARAGIDLEAFVV